MIDLVCNTYNANNISTMQTTTADRDGMRQNQKDRDRDVASLAHSVTGR